MNLKVKICKYTVIQTVRRLIKSYINLHKLIFISKKKTEQEQQLYFNSLLFYNLVA